MIFPWNNVKAFGFHDGVFFIDGVVNGYLISALSNLALPIKHKASTKWIYFAVIGARSMTLSSLNLLSTVILDVLPFRLCVLDIVAHQASQIKLCYLSIGIEVQTSKQIGPVINAGQGSTFSGSRLPVKNWHFYNGYIKTLPLLHSLNIGLETTSQFFNELVSRNIISWLSNEKFRAFIILVTWGLNNFDIVLGPVSIQFSLIKSLNGMLERVLGIHSWSLSLLRGDSALVIVVNVSMCFTSILNWREPNTFWVGCRAKIGSLCQEFVVRFGWVELVTSKNHVFIWVRLSLLHRWNAVLH